MQINWKNGFADQSLAWCRSKKHNFCILQKNHNVLDVPSHPNYTVTELNDVFLKKEPPIFIYKGMTLTLKLLSGSSGSTKMPFFPAVRPTVIRGQIITPHTRLHV